MKNRQNNKALIIRFINDQVRRARNCQFAYPGFSSSMPEMRMSDQARHAGHDSSRYAASGFRFVLFDIATDPY